MAACKSYCILVYDGDNLFAITGPFKTRELAQDWVKSRLDKGLYQIVPLWKPTEVETLTGERNGS